MTSSTSEIVIGKGGERWKVTSIKLPVTDSDGNTSYLDAKKMDLLDEQPKGEFTLPVDTSDKKVQIFEVFETDDGKINVSEPLPGSVIPSIDEEMKVHPEEEKRNVIPISYGAQNDTWKSTGIRSKHYDPMPEIPYDQDLSGNREAQTWAFNVLPLAAEQKETFLQTLIKDQIRIDNLKTRERALPKLPTKRKVEKILNDEFTKDNPKGRAGVKTKDDH